MWIKTHCQSLHPPPHFFRYIDNGGLDGLNVPTGSGRVRPTWACRARLPAFQLHPTVIAGVKQLIQDPNRLAWSLFITRPGEPNDDRDDGLIRKGKQYRGQAVDNKWFFHWRPTLAGLLAERGVSIEGYEEFFEACRFLHTTYLDLVEKIALEFDRQCPGFDLHRRMTTQLGRDIAVLRVIVYDRGGAIHNTDNIIARQHTDRDCITLHVAEGRPGLHIGAEREPYVVQPNKMLAFAGQKLERLTKGRLTALPHDVKDVETDDAEQRWAMVFFSHIANPTL